MPNHTQALRYHQYGDPFEQLTLEELPLRPIASHEVLVKMRASVINPADFGRIMGVYGSKAALPATAGLEGIGQIIDCGDRVSNFKKGDRVSLPVESGPWQSHLIADPALQVFSSSPSRRMLNATATLISGMWPLAFHLTLRLERRFWTACWTWITLTFCTS